MAVDSAGNVYFTTSYQMSSSCGDYPYKYGIFFYNSTTSVVSVLPGSGKYFSPSAPYNTIFNNDVGGSSHGLYYSQSALLFSAPYADTKISYPYGQRYFPSVVAMSGAPAASPASASPSPATATASTTPGCWPLLYRLLPRTDLVGTLIGASLSPPAPFAAASETSCGLACCSTPACTAYAYAYAPALQQCFLFANVTALVPSNLVHSGALLSAYS